MRIAFLEPGSNSARPTPPPGGGHNAYKAVVHKPKGLTRLSHRLTGLTRFGSV